MITPWSTAFRASFYCRPLRIRQPSRSATIFYSASAPASIPVIVTSRVLNEGVDVPEASVAVVLSGTGSQREYVQRLGASCVVVRANWRYCMRWWRRPPARNRSPDAAGPALQSNRIVSSICSNLSYSLLRGEETCYQPTC